MRIIAAIGRLGIDLEARVQPKGKIAMAESHDVEVHDVHSDTDVAPHIIGFRRDDEDGDG